VALAKRSWDIADESTFRQRNTETRIAHCMLAGVVLVFILGVSAKVHANPTSHLLPILTTAEQVHGLTYEESLREYPVHLRSAQVLYYNSALGNLFVRDNGHGVYIDTRGQLPLPLHSGDVLDVAGVTGPGGYAPVIERARIRVTANLPLPQAPHYSLDHLLAGVEDCQWVEV
jgi:hypothetical protein